MTARPDLAPGDTLGILGGGQLARMTALAARPFGFRVAVLDPDPEAPAAALAERVIPTALDDLEGARALAAASRAVTCEFENVPAASLEACAAVVPTRPGAEVFAVAQHRLREKVTLRALGVPVPEFWPLRDRDDLGLLPDSPLILKTARSGYDGKGQRRSDSADGARAAWRELGEVEVIAEEVVDFVAELSVVVARDRGGEIATWEPFENRHRRHILDLTSWPASLHPTLRAEADSIARRIAIGLQLVGLLCVELFATRDGRLLVNELAPRPHNSGHLTIEAAATSQFAQLVRIAAGLPLGSTEMVRPAAMVNLLGELWQGDPPDPAAALAVPGVTLHLYGKTVARRGRKMGHLTACAGTVDEAVERVEEARRRFAPAAP